jgi:type VI protein secretion system component VasK
VRANQRPAPPPLEGNDQLVTAVITAAWAVALVVLLVVRTQLPASGRWWVWTCLAGFCMGLFGLWYVPRMKRARARRAQRRAELRAQPAAQPCSSDSKTVSSTETPGTSTKS